MVTVTWKVEDGYYNNGTHTTAIDEYELEDCETEEDRLNLIETIIQSDFELNVSFSIVHIENDQQ